MKKYIYNIYGYKFLVPFKCATLHALDESVEPDVVIQESRFPKNLEAPVAGGRNWEARPDAFLVRGGRTVGRFLVEDGRRISFYKSPEYDEYACSLLFLDTVIAAFLQQRGYLVLHANTALTPKGAVTISGDSGAGKSTTLTALLQAGNAMLADDVTVLQIDENHTVQVLPGVPQMNLLEETAENLNVDISGYARHRVQRNKAVVPTHEKMAPHPAPLHALFILEKSDTGTLSTRELKGREKFGVLQNCAYGPLFVEDHQKIFPLFSAVLEQIPLFKIQRPADLWTTPDVVNFILSV